MCAFNAQRDSYLLRPLQTEQGQWSPLPDGDHAVPTFPIKWLKGRPRASALLARQAGRVSHHQGPPE